MRIVLVMMMVMIASPFAIAINLTKINGKVLLRDLSKEGCKFVQLDAQFKGAIIPSESRAALTEIRSALRRNKKIVLTLSEFLEGKGIIVYAVKIESKKLKTKLHLQIRYVDSKKDKATFLEALKSKIDLDRAANESGEGVVDQLQTELDALKAELDAKTNATLKKSELAELNLELEKAKAAVLKAQLEQAQADLEKARSSALNTEMSTSSNVTDKTPTTSKPITSTSTASTTSSTDPVCPKPSSSSTSSTTSTTSTTSSSCTPLAQTTCPVPSMTTGTSTTSTTSPTICKQTLISAFATLKDKQLTKAPKSTKVNNKKTKKPKK